MFDDQHQCNTCGVGYVLPSGKCDHCNVQEFEPMSEADKLREAIRDAGFSVMQTSGRWSIHDVSKFAEAEQEKTNQIIGENINLELRVKELEFTLKEAFELFQACDAERLNDVHKADAEADKWKSEGDMYGWNFHKGMASGMTQASIVFYRVFRRLKQALK